MKRKPMSAPVDGANAQARLKTRKRTLLMSSTFLRPTLSSSDSGAYIMGKRPKDSKKIESVSERSDSFVIPNVTAMAGSAGAMIELLSGVTKV
jgi:hypothetical protein